MYIPFFLFLPLQHLDWLGGSHLPSNLTDILFWEHFPSLTGHQIPERRFSFEFSGAPCNKSSACRSPARYSAALQSCNHFFIANRKPQKSPVVAVLQLLQPCKCNSETCLFRRLSQPLLGTQFLRPFLQPALEVHPTGHLFSTIKILTCTLSSLPISI